MRGTHVMELEGYVEQSIDVTMEIANSPTLGESLVKTTCDGSFAIIPETQLNPYNRGK